MKIIKSMVLFFMFCAVFLASALSFPTQSSASVAPEISAHDVKRIAEEGKDPFVGAIFMEYRKSFEKEIPQQATVSTLQEAMDPNSPVHRNLVNNPAIRVGEPFEVYTISPDDIRNYSPSVDISSILVSTDQWLVPVTFHGKQRGMLTVAYFENAWQVVGMGVSDVSETVDNNARMGVAGENPPAKFVRIQPNSLDFVVTNTDSNGKSRILPSSYTIEALGLDDARADSSGLYDAADFPLSRLANH